MPRHISLFIRCLLLLGALLLLVSCAAKTGPQPEPEPEEPPLSTGPTPSLEDKARFFRFNGGGSVHQSLLIDLRTQGLRSWMELEAPIRYSLEYVSHMNANQRAATTGNVPLTWGQISISLKKMLDILPQLDRRPELLAQHFTWFELEPTPVMSGYYTPEMEVSLTKQPGYEFPIYRMPQDLKVRAPGHAGPRFYRLENGEHVPYYTRREIDKEGVLKGKGLEIAWARSAFDVFNLQVEGAGRVRLPDGRIRTLVYAAKNSRKFKGLGAILRDENLLPISQLTLPYIRKFYEEHPKLTQEKMLQNESYIFFRFGDEGAEGTIGRPLTPMVSLATDPRLLPLGTMVVMNTDIPAEGGNGQRKVRGFGLAQDTGTAIKGARLDYYVGEGAAAEAVGCKIWNTARIYLLVSRDVMGYEQAEH